MLSLKARQDQWKLTFPKDFLVDEIVKKYTPVLAAKKSFITTPIDFINESIQSIQVLGFSSAAAQQPQTMTGEPLRDSTRTLQNKMFYAANDFIYRSDINPVKLVDKTLNVQFRHTLGFLNYFMLFENFFYLYCRDTEEPDLLDVLYIDIANENGEVYCKIKLTGLVIDTMDMLDLNYTQPVAQSQTFQVQFKYSNFEFEFL